MLTQGKAKGHTEQSQRSIPAGVDPKNYQKRDHLVRALRLHRMQHEALPDGSTASLP
jgi:hypothetical protein